MRHVTIGLMAASAVTTLPDDLLSWGGKLLFTAVAAAVGAIVANLVNRWMNRK